MPVPNDWFQQNHHTVKKQKTQYRSYNFVDLLLHQRQQANLQQKQQAKPAKAKKKQAISEEIDLFSLAAGEGFEIKNLLAATCYSLLSHVIPLKNSHFICYHVLP